MAEIIDVREIDHGDWVERITTFSGGVRLTQAMRESAQPAIVNAVSFGPGNRWAAAAFKAGVEDEYVDAMRCRYGGEW